jgi:hypothetical protein
VVVPFTWLFHVLSRRSGQLDGRQPVDRRTHDRSVDELKRMG